MATRADRRAAVSGSFPSFWTCFFARIARARAWAIAIPIALLLYLAVLRAIPRTTFVFLALAAAALAFLARRLPNRVRRALYALFVFAYPAAASASPAAARFQRRRLRLVAIAFAIDVVMLAKPWDHVFKLVTPLRLAGGVQQPLVSADQQRADRCGASLRRREAGAERDVLRLLEQRRALLLPRDCPRPSTSAVLRDGESAAGNHRRARAQLVRARRTHRMSEWHRDHRRHDEPRPRAARLALSGDALRAAFAEDGVIFWQRK